MRNMLKVALPFLVIFIAAGCSSGKLASIEDSYQRQQQRQKELMEQVDRNAANIKTSSNELAQINQRLAKLESMITTSETDDAATILEIKENLVFLGDQLARLDKSVQTQRPRPLPQGVSAFKPGGFDVNTSYQSALSGYRAKRFETAITGFKELLTVSPQSSLADNAQYWIGECYDAMGQYNNALEAFDKVFDYPKSNKLSDAHLKVGLIYAKTGKTDAAKEELRAVIANYPDSDAAAVAETKLKALGE